MYIFDLSPPLRTHLPIVTQGFFADGHGFTMKSMLVGGGVRIGLVLIFCTCLQLALVDIFILPPPLRPTPTPVIQNFCADAHGLTRMLVGGVLRPH